MTVARPDAARWCALSRPAGPSSPRPPYAPTPGAPPPPPPGSRVRTLPRRVSRSAHRSRSGPSPRRQSGPDARGQAIAQAHRHLHGGGVVRLLETSAHAAQSTRAHSGLPLFDRLLVPLERSGTLARPSEAKPPLRPVDPGRGPALCQPDQRTRDRFRSPGLMSWPARTGPLPHHERQVHDKPGIRWGRAARAVRQACQPATSIP